MTILKVLMMYHLACELVLILCYDSCPTAAHLIFMHPAALLIVLMEGGLRGIWALFMEYSLLVVTLFAVARGIALNGFAAWGVVVSFALVYLIWLKAANKH